MKSIQMGLLFVFVLQLSLAAQTTPEALLGQLPAVPNVVCATDSSVVNRFTNRIYEVKSALQQVTDRINAEAQTNEENSKDKVLSNVAQQMGLSKDDMNQLQQENNTEEQVSKTANKVLGKQYNLQYCEKMSPLQTNAIAQYLTTLKALFPDYRRLTEVQNEIVKFQFGEITPCTLR